MGEDGFALFNGKREEEAGGEYGEHAGDEGGEGDPEEMGQGSRMVTRSSRAFAPEL